MLWSKWTGVTPQDLEHEGASVDARMKAEAGEMRCVGTVHEAAMRGTYSFTPDEGFVKRMEAMDSPTSRQTGCRDTPCST